MTVDHKVAVHRVAAAAVEAVHILQVVVAAAEDIHKEIAAFLVVRNWYYLQSPTQVSNWIPFDPAVEVSAWVARMVVRQNS